MKKYIDFDGVIMDTEDLLFYFYRKMKEKGVKLDKLKYIQNFDWDVLLNEAKDIDDAIEVLKTMKDAAILTKIHSMENEGCAKVKFLREHGVKNEIILVPYQLKKVELVNPFGNILIDDNISNLNEWHNKGGIPIYFNKDNLDVDTWGITNEIYPKIKSLKQLNNIKF